MTVTADEILSSSRIVLMSSCVVASGTFSLFTITVCTTSETSDFGGFQTGVTRRCSISAICFAI
jgi:hypothetical protein